MLQPSAKEYRIPLVDASGGEVEILFSWCGDRWSHTVVIRSPDGSAAWRSVEGPQQAGDAAWPASPVLVEVSRVPQAAAVVGVGRAGRSHYSVSFTAKPAGSVTAKPADGSAPSPAQAGPRLLVECACRIHEPPGWIGSTYEQIDPEGRHRGLIRMPASIDLDGSGPLPRTVAWSYEVGPTGPLPCEGRG